MAAAGFVSVVCLFWSMNDPWLSDASFHPAWLVVLALATGYGLRGLFAGLAASISCLSVLSLLLGSDFAGLLVRATHSTDLSLLAAAIVVAGISMHHERRRHQLTSEVDELHTVRADESATMGALEDAVSSMRSRHDRIDLSISFWRRISERMQAGDPREASKAAIELALVRLSARAAIVREVDGSRLQTVAYKGAWSAASSMPPDIFSDATIEAAVESREVSWAPGNTDEASDVAVPLICKGTVRGVLAVRGVSRQLDDSELRDLSLVTRWLARSFEGVERVERRGVANHNRQETGQPVAQIFSFTGGHPRRRKTDLLKRARGKSGRRAEKVISQSKTVLWG